MTKEFYIFSMLLFAGNSLFCQYTVNGNASQNNCHCYTLTTDAFNETGSVWNNNKINLNRSFDFWFDVFLGCADNDGADGIAFVLQPISTSVGSQGSGLGYSGIKPAVGVTIDTWQNGSPFTSDGDGDPIYDHIAIQLNGDLNHRDSMAPLSINNIAGPVQALDGSSNIEDCQWHVLRIKWDEPSKTLSAYIDGVFRLSAVKDFTKEVFAGDPNVFWGFTGSTGGAKNLQQVCTALKPLFTFLPGQKRCIGEKIIFIDSTISFAPIHNTTWDFGDGSPVDATSINPVHTYNKAGNYTVVQTVSGADGCTEINTQQLVIGSVPLADFTFNKACLPDSSVNFINASSAAFGTIDNWFWDFGNGDTSILQDPSKFYTSPGPKTVKLAVKSLEGCMSDTIRHVVKVYEKPIADFSFTDNQCSNTGVKFNATTSTNNIGIANWAWFTNGVAFANTQDPLYSFNSPGRHLISLLIKSGDGCISDTITKPINVLPRPIAYFKNDPICLSTPVSFTDSSYTTDTGTIRSWWWNLGNGVISTAKNTRTVYTGAGNIIIAQVVKDSKGCVSDTLKKTIGIESIPLAAFGYGLPICENQMIRFSNLSSIDSGAINHWIWVFDNNTITNVQNPDVSFTGGNHQIKLVVQNGTGCNRDTAVKTIFVNSRPIVGFIVSDACKNTAVPFNAISQPGSNIIRWQWDFDDGTTAVSKDTQHIYNNGGNFSVKLFVISQEGCVSDTIEKKVIIYSTNAFAGNDTIAAAGQPVQLQASGGVNYEWSPATGLNNPIVYNPVATNKTDRSYILKASTPVGCASFDTIRIKIYDGPEIYIPRAFTPNGDGLNEILKALPAGVKQFKSFTIYNRFGQIVFHTTAASKGWDGSFNGKAQPAGVYTWIASATGYNGNEIFRKGTVMLMR